MGWQVRLEKANVDACVGAEDQQHILHLLNDFNHTTCNILKYVQAVLVEARTHLTLF